MRYQLPSRASSGRKPHAIDDIIQSSFNQTDKVFTRIAVQAIGFHENTPELLFRNAIHHFSFLLFFQLQPVIRSLSASLPMLAWPISPFI